MDYQEFVDTIIPETCVISVERFRDGSYGNIRIEAGNKAYIESLEGENETSRHMLNRKFVPGSDYQCYLPQDMKFEDACYRCAILKQPSHAYVRPEHFDMWMDISLLPLESDPQKPNIGYCTYTIKKAQEANAKVMANLSRETAAEVLNTCIKLRGADDFETAVRDVMGDISRICDSRHCCLLLIDFERCKCTMLGQAFSNTARRIPMKHWEDESHYRLVLSWANLVEGNNCLIVKNQEEMEIIREKNPEWYESLQRATVNSLVLFPLKAGGELLGYIWATNFETNNAARIKETLELTTFFLASEIANYQLLMKLHTMSTIDMLTGVFNRNALDDKMDELRKTEDDEIKSVGVVFADLNGLKRVNDIDGHRAGDLLLKNAAMALLNIFVGGDIFRAGGDEFIVILVGATPADLKEKAEKLKANTDQDGKVSFAVGYSYQEDCRKVREAMEAADELMYQDKQQYYLAHPTLRRN